MMRTPQTADNYSEKELAPIALFVYKRPEHTQKTIAALQKNTLANQSKIYIFADGERSEKDRDNVETVRKILQSANGFGEKEIILRERNYGLADNIVDGIASVIQQHGKVIVVEDDIVTSPYFLQYMNDALNCYENEDRVMAISGYTPDIDRSDLPETFFTPWFECWGWATWERAWNCFTRDTDLLIKETTKKEIDVINFNGTDHTMWNMVLQNHKGTLRTWAVFFHVAICKHNGLVLFCKDNLSINIGHDGSGENCLVNKAEQQQPAFREEAVTEFTDVFEVNETVAKRLMAYNVKRRLNVGLFRRGLLYIKENGVQGIAPILKKVLK